MGLRIIILVVVCVSAKPFRQNIYKSPSPFPEITGLEVEFRRALRSRDLVKAFRIESQLEAEILHAALNAVTNNKNPDNSRHEMEQLARIVARDKRMVDTLTSMIPPNEEISANSINEGLRLNDDVDNVGMTPNEISHDVFQIQDNNNKEESINVNEINNGTTPGVVVNSEPMRIVVEEDDEENDTNLNLHDSNPNLKLHDTDTNLNLHENDTDEDKRDMTRNITEVMNRDNRDGNMKGEGGNSNEKDKDGDGTERDKNVSSSTELVKTELVPPLEDSKSNFSPVQGSQKQVEENPDEESEPGGIAGLLSGFLGSILTPEGGIDLSALTGLIGGLSVEKPDGTYDFTGLQETIGSLFGGDGGGSDVGLFIGGLTNAFLRGITGNQGAKGAGKFSGNVVLSVLPALSAPAKPDENTPYGAYGHPQKGIDPFGFIGGFLKTFLSGSKSVSVGQQHTYGYGNAPSKLMQVRQRKPK